MKRASKMSMLPPNKRMPDQIDHGNDTSELSEKQNQVLGMAMSGQSFFFTGEAGTGKSFVLKHLVARMRELHGDDRVYITASTGIAACAVGGVTLHSYAGLGLAEELAPALIDKLIRRRTPPLRKAYDRWRGTAVLVIEECSMVHPDFFTKLESVACAVRCEHSKPFGGIQVILCGDFFQLPPVCRQDRAEGEPAMIFETRAWRAVVGDRILVLDEIFRQKEPALISLLSDIRSGVLTETSKRTLEDRKRLTEQGGTPDGAVRLFATRVQADAVNSANLERLPGEQRVLRAIDKGEPQILAKLSDQWMAPRELVVKVGALVMLIYNKNITTGLVNGVTGTVLNLSPLQVRFNTFDGGYVVETMANEIWEIKNGGVVVASRTQVPLMLAWAITIHKCQGMSIDRVEVNLDRIFERGQVYVAFSRATSLAGLFVRGRMPAQSLLMPNEKVVQWWSESCLVLDTPALPVNHFVK